MMSNPNQKRQEQMLLAPPIDPTKEIILPQSTIETMARSLLRAARIAYDDPVFRQAYEEARLNADTPAKHPR